MIRLVHSVNCNILTACAWMLFFAGVTAARDRPMAFEDLWNIVRVGPPAISPDAKWVAVEATKFSMEKNESTSDIWLLATDDSVQKQLTHGPGKHSGPRWSPDGKTLAFVTKRGDDEVPQIYTLAIDGGEARRVSKLPTAPAALKWSADGRTIYCIGWTWPEANDDADHKSREKAQKDNKVQAVVVDSLQYRYWDKWLADGKRPTVYAVDFGNGAHRNLLARTGLHLQPLEPSAGDYDVSPDGKELAIVADSVPPPHVDTNVDVYSIALDGSSAPKNRTAENPAQDLNPVYSPDGKHLAYLRQMVKHASDCQQLYLLNRESGAKRSLTAKLDRSAGNPRWMPDGKRLCFEADDAGLVNVFFVGIDRGEPRAFPTGSSEKAMDIAKSDRMAAYLRSSFNEPPTVMVHGPKMREPKKISHFNDSIVDSWRLGKVESVKFRGAGNDEVQMFVLYPPGFDPTRKWPLVQIVHGGPHVGIMSDFSFRWNPQLWAAQGYVVGVVNFHGSSGFGFKFTDSITGDFATKPAFDVEKGTDWFVQKPWIDANRMAAAGGSYGGYMMAWLNGHTDRYKAMICHAGVYSYHSQMASDAVLGRERSLGAFPWTAIGKIDAQSAQRYSANFQTPTLVLHGERDYRVPVTHGFEYYNTLKLKGVPSRLVYFPDENHWVLKPQNARLWHREVFGWLEKYIGKGPT